MCCSPFVPFLFPQRARGTSEPSNPPLPLRLFLYEDLPEGCPAGGTTLHPHTWRKRGPLPASIPPLCPILSFWDTVAKLVLVWCHIDTARSRMLSGRSLLLSPPSQLCSSPYICLQPIHPTRAHCPQMNTACTIQHISLHPSQRQ